MQLSDKKLKLSIVLPCLNEAETIESVIIKAKQSMLKGNISGEIIVADNGSIDGSIKIAQKNGANVIRVKEKGYGNALMGGIDAAKGQYIIMGDSDDSYDFSNLMPFIDKLDEGYDLVVGNRFLGGIEPGAMPFHHKYLGNPVLSSIGRILFDCSIKDFHCGLRGFRRSSIVKLDLRTTGMEFASEMIIKATLHKLRITEVPTKLFPDGRNRPPHLKSWSDGWRHLRFMLLYSPVWLLIYPGIILLLNGLFVGIWLLSGPKNIGNIVFDIHTLLYSMAAVLTGFQLILFGAFYKILSITERYMPQNKKFDQVFKIFTLEKGLFAGFLIFMFGIAGSIYSVSFWESVSFGELDPIKMLRIVIPSATMIILGCQVFFSSIFFSMLGISRK